RSPVAADAARAFASALSAKVAPVSGGSSTPAGSGRSSRPGSSAESSRSLCSFRVATTSFTTGPSGDGQADRLELGGAPLVDAGGAAGAAAGLEDVAVEVDRPLPECPEVDDAADRAPDQPLDLHRPAVGAPARDVALLALPGRGGQHRVLGCDPAPPLALHPAR